jgi:hypothetical protein
LRFPSLYVLSPILLGALIGCAGPSTPLGSIWAFRPGQVSQIAESQEEAPSPTIGAPGVRILFKPARQVLHGPKPFIVHIEDARGIPAKPRVQVRYDGIDVTTSFLRQASWLPGRTSTQAELRIPVIRLSPQFDHHIEIRYFNKAGRPSISRYAPPVCRIFDSRKVRHTDDFNPEPSLLATIDQLSQSARVNPALVTGLIAQESSFNPRSVSWAKAIGLTQVTPIAENELVDKNERFSRWPSYRGLKSMPASLVKLWVLSGKINETNDWRLDKSLSVEGGVAYLRLLEDRWVASELASHFNDTERTKLALASYNSGYARVQSAVKAYGKNWLNAPGLTEARRYVNRIFSYCDFFSQEDSELLSDGHGRGGLENEHENKT